ncbi:hypothetical protein AGMMS49992_20090 [Clostridia bacterium]|nr:hypothetical protein AGMMS49992_20090 [Clostridia bacterium]
MTPFIEMRNYMMHGLSEYLGMPVRLSNQAVPMPAYPFIMYTVLTNRVPTGGMGNRSWIPRKDAVITRLEQVNHATISITCCSADHPAAVEPFEYVYGEDEAQTIAERAMDWFEHIARDELRGHGIVVVDVMEANSRTNLLIDEELRRYGFDIQIRYGEIMDRLDSAIKTVPIIAKPY